MKFSTNGMQHTPATTMVFQTDEYKKFELIKGNRELDMNKIKRIMSDIENGINLLKFCPVLVVEKDSKLEVIDGQHRFVVAKKLKHPVFYIIAESLSLYDIARMNSNQEKWKAKDFVNCYIELGNQNYVKLQNLLKKYPGFPMNVAISLLSVNRVHANATNIPGKGSAITSSFQTGKFEVKFETEAVEFIETVGRFNVAWKWTRPFMQAVEKVINSKKFPIDELIRKVNASPEELHNHSLYKDILTNLEQLANKGKRDRVIIH